MATPTICITVAPPIDNKPLINVAPPVTLGPLIFTGQLQTGTISINVQVKVGTDIRITTTPDKGPSFVAASAGDDDYRGMRSTPEGKPQVGDSARELGVRVGGDNPDVEVDENGMIDPNKPMKHNGKLPGMSVAPDPYVLASHRRPPEFGGTGKDPVWSIDTDKLGPDLKYTQDSETHGLIQPSDTMALEDYRAALANTQDDWTKVNPGGPQ